MWTIYTNRRYDHLIYLVLEGVDKDKAYKLRIKTKRDIEYVSILYLINLNLSLIISFVIIFVKVVSLP
jgi:hypothetical protein